MKWRAYCWVGEGGGGWGGNKTDGRNGIRTEWIDMVLWMGLHFNLSKLQHYTYMYDNVQ